MPTPSYRVLVPSSERKSEGNGAHRAYTFTEAQHDRSLNRFPSLTEPRLEACRAFHEAMNGRNLGAVVLKVKGPALKRAIADNLAIMKSPLLAAIERECGPFIRALAPETLAQAVRRQLDRHLLLVCPLLGLLAPTDHVPLYRCPVGAAIPGWNRFHSFWKPHVTKALGRLCSGRTVYSFLPKRMLALWAPDHRNCDLVEIKFYRRRADGRFLPENAGSGRAAGELVRHLFEKGVSRPEELEGFRSQSGHAYKDDLGTRAPGHRTLVFVR